MKPIAIVILNWNGLHFLKEYLPSLLQKTPRDLAEVIVVDNASSDDSVAWLQSGDLCSEVRLITLDTNYGFAGGYNRGIDQIENPYILLLNSDVKVSEGWLEPLYNLISNDPLIAAVQPTIRSLTEPHKYEYAGALGGYIDFLGYPFCRGRIFETTEEDTGTYGTTPLPIFWSSGAAMLVDRSKFVEVGGFSEAFFAHQEEIDLCWRWACRGYSLYAVPSSIVYHLGGGTLPQESPHKTFLNFRNNLWMLYRMLPSQKVLWTLLLRLWLDGLASLHFLLEGKRSSAWAVCRAWWAFFKDRPKRPSHYDRHRGYLKVYTRSILVQYHIYRRKSYRWLAHPPHTYLL